MTYFLSILLNMLPVHYTDNAIPSDICDWRNLRDRSLNLVSPIRLLVFQVIIRVSNVAVTRAVAQYC